jgi:tetratricopeptide (TPR) repeat protein
MRRDERGLPLSTDSADAAAALDRAVEHYLKFHLDTAALLADALAADGDFMLAHVFKAYLLLSAANPAHDATIAAILRTAERHAAAATPRERMHLAAAQAWARGALDESFRIWRALLDATPTDLLAVRICDTTWFRHGQTALIREQADRLAPSWSPALPGHDSFQTVWAFAHEETGDYAAAERAVDAAVEQDQTNFFAHHVKAHVMEMECRPREGRDWLEAQRGTWHLGNNLVHHLWWHRALMELELGDLDAVLASYDANIRNLDAPLTRAAPDHYIDLQNAAALLWRLEQMGVGVGNRWQELADKAEARIGETGHLLLVPHLMLALAATGKQAAAERFVAALRSKASDAALWTAPAIADAVLPVSEAVLAHRRGDHARVVALLAPRQEQIRLLGGSNAQRDLVFQMLADSAMRAGRRDVLAPMIAEMAATRAVPPTRRAGYAAAASWLEAG